MTKLNCLIKASLLTCVVIAGQSYAFNPNGNSTAWRNDNIGGALGEYSSTPPEVMAKTHRIKLTIINNTDLELNGPNAWYNSGRIALGSHWPESIPANGGRVEVDLYENIDTVATGCSGYVNYLWGGQPITFAFSNPFFGTNKLGVGTGGKSVWDNMGDHDYKQFTENFTINDIKLKAVAMATAGGTNLAKVVLSYDD